MGVLAGSCGITLNPAERRRVIIDGGNAQAAAAGGKVLWKDSLLDEVQGLAEHPVPLLADFDAAYLEVPREVLLTSMLEVKDVTVTGRKGRVILENIGFSVPGRGMNSSVETSPMVSYLALVTPAFTNNRSKVLRFRRRARAAIWSGRAISTYSMLSLSGRSFFRACWRH